MSRHHQQIKNDPRWKAARAAVLERDGYACRREGCGSTDRLEVDHVLELAAHPELAFEPDNLITLCRLCHQKKDKNAIGDIPRREWINPKYKETLSIL